MWEKTTKGEPMSTFATLGKQDVDAEATLFSLAGFEDVAQHYNLRGSVDAADGAMSGHLPALTTDGVTKENHNERGVAIKCMQSNDIFGESGAELNADGERDLEDADDDIHSNDGKNEDSEDSDNNGQRGNNEFDNVQDDNKDKGGASYNKREYHIDVEPENRDSGSSGDPRKPAWWPFVCVAIVTAVCAMFAPHLGVNHAGIAVFLFTIAAVATLVKKWNSNSFSPILWLLVGLSFLLASFVFGHSSITLQFKVATGVLEILVVGPLAMYGWDKRGAPGTAYDFFSWWGDYPAFHYLGALAKLTGFLYCFAVFLAKGNHVLVSQGRYQELPPLSGEGNLSNAIATN